MWIRSIGFRGCGRLRVIFLGGKTNRNKAGKAQRNTIMRRGKLMKRGVNELGGATRILDKEINAKTRRRGDAKAQKGSGYVKSEVWSSPEKLDRWMS